MISFKEVSHTYKEGQKEKRVLSGLSFFIEKGKFVAVTGPNGSGKSTLLKLIRGIEHPVEGRVEVAGLPTDSEEYLGWATKKIGYIMENPKMQVVSPIVYEDLLFSMENLNYSEDTARERIMQIAEELNLKDLLKRPVESLSDGEVQRVVLAGVLVVKPDIILSDESTSWLDYETSREVMVVFRKLCSEGKTVIHVTHDPCEMIEADLLLVLNRGKIAYMGKPQDVLKEALELYEAGISVPLSSLIASFVRNKLPSFDGVFLRPEDFEQWLK